MHKALKVFWQNMRYVLGNVNFDKSTVFFNTNIPVNGRMHLSSNMGVRHSNNAERYLGLPNLVSRNKKASFHVLKILCDARFIVGVPVFCHKEAKRHL